MNHPTKNRRLFLQTAAGVTFGLPWLEGLKPRTARAQDANVPPYAIFLRQANGVAQAQQNTEIGIEPERFFPSQKGLLTPETMADRAVGELVNHREQLLVVGNVNGHSYGYGDGHANGALQCLTAQGPTQDNQQGASEAAGESIDHRIGRELNPDGRDSLFLYAGIQNGWLNGPCISYRGPANRRSAIENPWNAYLQVSGNASPSAIEALETTHARRNSINDLIRDQLSNLLSHPRLSSSDQRRLQQHQDAVRDLEVNLSCYLEESAAEAIENQANGFSSDGNVVLRNADLHLQVAAMAVACGYTRSVTLQVGNGNDVTNYPHPTTGALMENYHYISHRRASHDSSGSVIRDAHDLHHSIDLKFARRFNGLLDRLAEYGILDSGVSVWLNDLANGPPHSHHNIPYILAGSANGFLKTGQYLDVTPGQSDSNHNRLLNTIGSAVGLRNASGDWLDDFGNPERTPGTLPEIIAV